VPPPPNSFRLAVVPLETGPVRLLREKAREDHTDLSQICPPLCRRGIESDRRLSYRPRPTPATRCVHNFIGG